MTTEHDLDARLRAAIGVREEDLSPLPAAFLDHLHGLDAQAPDTGGASVRVLPPPVETPASLVAARQLVEDAHQRRGAHGRPHRRLRRTAVLLTAAAAVAAVAWTAAVTVAPHDATRPPAQATGAPSPRTSTTPDQIGANGIRLVAAETVTFPLTLDPAPTGLTPTFAMSGGKTPFGDQPVVWSADYRSAEDPGFRLWASTQDPRTLPDWTQGYTNDTITDRRTVSINGTQASLTLGTYPQPNCTYAPASPAQTAQPPQVCSHAFALLIWQRPNGYWVAIQGEDAHAQTAAIVTLAGSIVDRPQPVPLQVHLAPAGWTVSDYEDNTKLGLSNPAFDDQVLFVDLLERWRRETIDTPFQGQKLKSPISTVTVNGKPARLALVDDPVRDPDVWWLTGQLPGGAAFLLGAPGNFTQQQVLAIARQVTYAP